MKRPNQASRCLFFFPNLACLHPLYKDVKSFVVLQGREHLQVLEKIDKELSGPLGELVGSLSENMKVPPLSSSWDVAFEDCHEVKAVVTTEDLAFFRSTFAADVASPVMNEGLAPSEDSDLDHLLSDYEDEVGTFQRGISGFGESKRGKNIILSDSSDSSDEAYFDSEEGLSRQDYADTQSKATTEVPKEKVREQLMEKKIITSFQ